MGHATLRWAAIALIAVPVLLLGARCARNDEADVEAVRQAFASWDTAVVRNDGIAAAKAVSRASVERYVLFQDLALHGEIDEIDRLPTVEKVQVLLFRVLLEPAKLQALTPDEVVSFAVKQRLVGMGLTQGDRLEDIRIDGKRATGNRMLKDRTTDPQAVSFIQDPEGWRVDLLKAEFERMQQQLDDRVRESPKTASEFVFMIVELKAGRKLTPADFDPPLPRTRVGSVAP